MSRLYIVGGRQRSTRLALPGQWLGYEKAIVLELDTETLQVESRFEYHSPPDTCVEDNPEITFKAATLSGDRLYLCTKTEILILHVPGFERIGYISIPLFNDIHHVFPTSSGTIVIANTGLDMVVELEENGEVRWIWGAVEDDPWERFSKDQDYRLVASTQPHRSHPNFIFEYEDKLWVTRFKQRDAVRVWHREDRIPLDGERPHDGIVDGRSALFTEVDGHLAVADIPERKLQERYHLKEPDDDEHKSLGWCRGLCKDGDESVWIGFSRLRRTKIVSNIAWALKRTGLRDVSPSRPTRIALHSLVTGRRKKEIDMEPFGLNAIFSIHKVEEL